MNRWISGVLILTAALHILPVPCNQLHYYVLPSNGNNQDCPTGESCYTLSYCLNDLKNQSQITKVIFVLLPGVHYLYHTIVLEKYENISFIGQGQWVQGPSSGIYQSTVIVKCPSNEITGFSITSTRVAIFNTLTIMGCGEGLVSNIVNVNLQYVSFQNISNIGLHWYEQYDKFSLGAVIQNCNFYRIGFSNRNESCHACFSAKATDSLAIVHIIGSTFSFGTFQLHGVYFVGIWSMLIIDNCSFIDNVSQRNIKIISPIQFIDRSHISVTNTHFINNSVNTLYNQHLGSTDFGNMYVSILKDCIVKIVNCTFCSNKANGLHIDNALNGNSQIVIKNSTFENNIGNVGAALRIMAVDPVTVTILDVIVLFNKVEIPGHFKDYSAVYLLSSPGYSEFYISNMSIVNNEMTGLYAEGSCGIIFSSHNLIANNTSPGNGGGMWLDRDTTVHNSYIPGALVSFINNSAARYGGAIYSIANTYAESHSSYYSRPCSLTILTAQFSSNKAKYGSIIYGGYFYDCDSGSGVQSLLQCSNCQKKSEYSFKEQCHWEVFDNIAANLLPKTVSSDSIAICMCNSSTLDCLNRTFRRSVYPGQTVTFWLASVGMCGGVRPGALLTETDDGVNISLSSFSQQTGDVCMGFDYQIKKVKKDYGEIVFLVRNSLSIFLHVNISFLPCPSGFKIIKGSCECPHILAEILSDQVQCNLSLVLWPVIRDGNNWLYYDYQHNCTIVHKNCPFDYCNPSTVHLSLDQPDLQCMYNRSGTLCGGCKPGLSLMLGSNKCGYCENKYLSLVIAFSIAGVLLVAFLLVCNLTVSLGSINGLLFYANLVKLNENVFFSNNTRIPILSQFIDWVNLDLGIETCFYNGLDGYWKTWLQFAFPLYVWFLIIAIILSCHYFGKLSRLFGNNTVPVLATLILMSYTKLLRTITNALMVAVIKCEGSQQWNIWSVDGNVAYFSSKHIPLFVISSLFSVVGILYTLVVFSSQWLQRYSGRCCRSSYDPVIKLKPLIDAYAGPYKDRYRYWTGLLLIIRIVVTTTFSYTSGTMPQINNYIIIVIANLLMVFGKAGIYRNMLLSNLELFYIFNLALLCLLNILCVQMKWKFAFSVSIVLVAISFAVAVVTVCVHAFIVIQKSFFNRVKLTSLIEENEATKSLLQPVRGSSEEPHSPANIIQRRESLIFDFAVSDS